MPRMTKFAAIAVGAVAATILGAATVSAQTVELEREAGGHCPASLTLVNHVPTDTSCSIHVITEPGTTLDLFQHTGVSEMPFTGCQLEFEAAFAENGNGYIYNQALTEGGSCFREPCDEGAPNHRNIEWPAQIRETTPGDEQLAMTLCLYAHNGDPASEGSTGTSCTFNLHVNRVGHEYEFETGGDDHTSGCVNLGNVIEWEGHFVTSPPNEVHSGFELHHL